MNTDAKPFWARKYGSEPKYKDFSRLTRHGYIGVGWTYAGDISHVGAIADIEGILKETMPAARQYKENIIRRDAGILNNFINIAQIDDLVACHDQEADRLFIGRIKGRCVHETRLHNHFHLLRRVEWINPLHIVMYEGAKAMLDISSVFWQISNPQVLRSAYEKNASRIMPVETISEQ